MRCFEDSARKRGASWSEQGAVDHARGSPAADISEAGGRLTDAWRFNPAGMTESQFRESVIDGLAEVVSCIDLESAIDISDLPFVRRSILNYGLRDVTHLTSEEANFGDIERSVIEAVSLFETRVKTDSVAVNREVDFDSVVQKLRLEISAEAKSVRHSVPVDFVAEVDLPASKVSILKANTLG